MGGINGGTDGGGGPASIGGSDPDAVIGIGGSVMPVVAVTRTGISGAHADAGADCAKPGKV
jgi:hypothetical protein